MRGSERCLLNLIKGADPEQYKIFLWTNHKQLAELAVPYELNVQLDDFSPPFGFNYHPGKNGAFVDLLKLIKIGREIIQNIHPDLILSNSLAPCQWMVPISLIENIPLLIYLHTTYLPKSRLLSFAYGATHMIGVSLFSIQDFLDDGFPSRRSSVIYNGVDDLSIQNNHKETIRLELDIGADEFVITSICALVEWKKVYLAIDAFRLFSEYSGRAATLLVVGEGPCKEKLQQQSKGLRVKFCGWRTDIARVLDSSDCIIITAEKEAFALTPIEAASMRRTTVGARAGGMRELIIDGENGLFAEPGSPESFVQSLRTLRTISSLQASRRVSSHKL